jgi:D-tyrosyl-tRNA(Tyr) deacylase
MRAVVQRVSRASVRVGVDTVGEIGPGLVVLVGVGREDGPTDVDYIAGKVRDLRIFEDDQGKLNRSVTDAGGSLLVVSQFTLFGDARKGRRPSFDAAAPPLLGRQLYEELLRVLREEGLRVEAGVFQAHMHLELVNDGPVTILLDSRRAF